MRLISWNVNGIRSILKKGFLDFVAREQPDILCLQEVRSEPPRNPTGFGTALSLNRSDSRAEPASVELNLPAYEVFWNPAKVKAGYSGTAIFTKLKLLAVTLGMGDAKHDDPTTCFSRARFLLSNVSSEARSCIHQDAAAFGSGKAGGWDEEGRVITAEYDQFFLVNVYVPNSKRDLSRLPYRQEWDRDFLKFLKKLEEKKPVVFCGDLNVAHKEVDLANPESNRKNHGFTDEERAGIDQILENGFLDTFREFTSDGGHYTWWSQMNGCRSRNVGWRIDYFCISKSLRPHLEDAFILPDVMGSDHCPVGIELKLN